MSKQLLIMGCISIVCLSVCASFVSAESDSTRQLLSPVLVTGAGANRQSATQTYTALREPASNRLIDLLQPARQYSELNHQSDLALHSEASREMLNVWHIPANNEPPTVTMRNPLNVRDFHPSVYFYIGAYPQYTIHFAKVYIKRSDEPSFHEYDCTYDSQSNNNEYWVANVPNYFGLHTTVLYYLKAYNPNYEITYLYNNSAKTTIEAVAQASPYTFIVIGGINVPALDAFGVLLLVIGISGAIMLSRTFIQKTNKA